MRVYLKGSRTWRPVAIVSLLLCTAAAAEPEYWGDAEFHKEYPESVADCARHRKVEPPAADRRQRPSWRR